MRIFFFGIEKRNQSEAKKLRRFEAENSTGAENFFSDPEAIHNKEQRL